METQNNLYYLMNIAFLIMIFITLAVSVVYPRLKISAIFIQMILIIISSIMNVFLISNGSDELAVPFLFYSIANFGVFYVTIDFTREG